MIALGVRGESRTGAAMRGNMCVGDLLPAVRGDAARNRQLRAHRRAGRGFCCAYLAGTPKLVETWGERFWRVAAYGCVLLTALSFLKMYLAFAAAG